MNMRLGEFIDCIDEYVNIYVFDDNGDDVTWYNGKDSIDDFFTDYVISDFKIMNGLVKIWLELDAGVMFREIRDMIDRGDIEGARNTSEKASKLYGIFREEVVQ